MHFRVYALATMFYNFTKIMETKNVLFLAFSGSTDSKPKGVFDPL